MPTLFYKGDLEKLKEMVESDSLTFLNIIKEFEKNCESTRASFCISGLVDYIKRTTRTTKSTIDGIATRLSIGENIAEGSTYSATSSGDANDDIKLNVDVFQVKDFAENNYNKFKETGNIFLDDYTRERLQNLSKYNVTINAREFYDMFYKLIASEQHDSIGNHEVINDNNNNI